MCILVETLPGNSSEISPQLETAELQHCFLTPVQLNMLLTKIVTKQCNLKSLDISNNDHFHTIEKQLVEKAAEKLELFSHD